MEWLQQQRLSPGSERKASLDDGENQPPGARGHRRRSSGGHTPLRRRKLPVTGCTPAVILPARAFGGQIAANSNLPAADQQQLQELQQPQPCTHRQQPRPAPVAVPPPMQLYTKDDQRAAIPHDNSPPGSPPSGGFHWSLSQEDASAGGAGGSQPTLESPVAWRGPPQRLSTPATPQPTSSQDRQDGTPEVGCPMDQAGSAGHWARQSYTPQDRHASEQDAAESPDLMEELVSCGGTGRKSEQKRATKSRGLTPSNPWLLELLENFHVERPPNLHQQAGGGGAQLGDDAQPMEGASLRYPDTMQQDGQSSALQLRTEAWGQESLSHSSSAGGLSHSSSADSELSRVFSCSSASDDDRSVRSSGSPAMSTRSRRSRPMPRSYEAIGGSPAKPAPATGRLMEAVAEEQGGGPRMLPFGRTSVEGFGDGGGGDGAGSGKGQGKGHGGSGRLAKGPRRRVQPMLVNSSWPAPQPNQGGGQHQHSLAASLGAGTPPKRSPRPGGDGGRGLDFSAESSPKTKRTAAGGWDAWWSRAMEHRQQAEARKAELALLGRIAARQVD